jgi:hypothetical protein
VRDVRRVARELTGLGFVVSGGDTDGLAGEDLDRAATLSRWRTFVDTIRPGADVFLFYAGHGLQIGGDNYVVPIDADLTDDEPVTGLIRARTLVDEIATKTGPSGKVVVALDACREDPFGSDQLAAMMRATAGRSEAVDAVPQTMFGKGFATFKLRTAPDAAPTFVLFATAPGELALDGTGENSPFATALTTHMATRGLALQHLVQRVGSDVRRASGLADAVQIPWSETNLDRNFYFHPTTWRPVVELGLAGLIAGLAICAVLFDSRGRLPAPNMLPDVYYLLGAVFAPVVGYGTWRWGSGRWRDVGIAMLVTTAAFPPALYILGHVPSIDLDNYEKWVPRLRNLMAHPELVGVVFLCLIAGILFALVTFLGCRPQGDNFAGLAPPAGAIAIGLGVGIGYLAYATIKYALQRPDLDGVVITIAGALWFATLGAGLGYCYRHYVREHRIGGKG